MSFISKVVRSARVRRVRAKMRKADQNRRKLSREYKAAVKAESKRLSKSKRKTRITKKKRTTKRRRRY